MLIGYVMAFPAANILLYFEIIHADSKPGEIVMAVFYPLLWLDTASTTAHQVFSWLGELYVMPFLPPTAS